MTAAESNDDIDFLAGEYVLGTLDPTERRVVETHRRDKPELEAAIGRWEQMFAPLAAAVAPISPTEGLYAAIARRIAGQNAAVASPVAFPNRAANEDWQREPSGFASKNVVRLARSVRIWKTATTLVGTAAACLLIGIGLSGRPSGEGHTLIAFLQQPEGTPTFLVSVDLATRAMSVRPIKAVAQADKSYQLWLVSDKFDKVPKSLGLIGEGALTVEHGLSQYERTVVQDATYAVSVEPRGGSPKSVPTGPVLWTGRLVQAMP